MRTRRVRVCVRHIVGVRSRSLLRDDDGLVGDR